MSKVINFQHEEIKTKIRIISYHAILIGHRTSWGKPWGGMSKEKQKTEKMKKLSSQHKKYRHKINEVKKINQKKKKRKKQMVETNSHTHRSLGKKYKRKSRRPSVKAIREKIINTKKTKRRYHKP